MAVTASLGYLTGVYRCMGGLHARWRTPSPANFFQLISSDSHTQLTQPRVQACVGLPPLLWQERRSQVGMRIAVAIVHCLAHDGDRVCRAPQA